MFTRSRINLLEVKSIEMGQKTTNFKRHARPDSEAHSASIFYGSNRTLDLIFNSPEELKKTLCGIQYLMEDLKGEEDRDDLREVNRIR
jgi:hypothetical protein